MTTPSQELLNAIVSCAIKLENTNLYELLIKYLQKIDVDVEVQLNLLKQQDNYGEVDREHISDPNGIDSKIKRGTDWDKYDSDYDVVANYSQQRSDVITYPHHKAYIWGKTYGVAKLNLILKLQLAPLLEPIASLMLTRASKLFPKVQQRWKFLEGLSIWLT